MTHTPRVRDVMTVEVHSVRRGTPFKAVAELLAGHGVSAMPVVEGERTVVGVVSEADLLREQYPRRRWARRGRRYAAAGEVMTTPAITAGPETPVPEAARRMIQRHVKRLPVVDTYGKLLGIVSRADLVGLFARGDGDLRTEIEREVVRRALCVPDGDVAVSVREGVVTLSGTLERKSLVPIAETLTAQIPGVVAVVNELTYAVDDSDIRPVESANKGVLHDLWHRE